MKIPSNSINSYENFFNDIVSSITEENKNEAIFKIKEIFNNCTQTLIQELQADSSNKESYRILEMRLGKVDQKFIDEIHPYIEKILKIAKAGQIIVDDENLSLPQRFENMRLKISDPNLKAYSMANLYERNFEDVNPTDFSKEELIAMGPYLKRLDLRGTENWNVQDIYDILIASPNLKELSIVSNPNIETLPPLDFCEKLFCNNCSALRQLPNLHNCIELDCSHCTLLTSLPTLDECTTLMCNSCEELIALPNLPSCTMLDCGYCLKLTAIPSLPKGIDVDCKHCPMLSFLPELLHCTNLNCSGCSVLRTILAIPICEVLNYNFCPLLDLSTIPPQLIRREDAIGEAIRAAEAPQILPIRKIVQVRIDELNQNPIKVLLNVGESLLQGKGIPSIQYVEANGDISEAVDSGGLSRDFLTRLIKALILKSEEKGQLSFEKNSVTNNYQPILDLDKEITDDQKKGFRILGALFAECLSNDYVIDKFFHPFVFQGITSLSSQDLDALPEDLREIPNDLLFKLLFLMPLEAGTKYIQILNKLPNDLTSEDIDTLKAIIIEIEDEAEVELMDQRESILEKAKLAMADKIRKHDILLPIVLIAKQMRQTQVLRGDQSWDKFCELGAKSFQEKIEGQISGPLVYQSINWSSDVLEEEAIRIKEFVRKWIEEEASQEELRNFVFTITGLPAISPGAKLNVNLFNRGGNIPLVQTCFRSMDLSANFHDYKDFKLKLKILIEISINQEESGYRIL